MTPDVETSMTNPSGRRRYIVGAVKLPYERRDIAHAVITEHDARGFKDVIGADTPDDHDRFPVGANTTYAVELTVAEAAWFRAASNCRYVEPDGEARDGAVAIPAAATMQFMRAAFTGVDSWHGRDVTIGLLDGGTSTAVRTALGVTMLNRQNFQADDPGADEVTSTHGCLVAPALLPQGGRFLDAIVSNNAGVRTYSDSVAAATWCADNGATVLNYSGGGASASSVWNDLFDYLLPLGVQFFAPMGNSNLQQADYPAALSTSYVNVHSSISFDKATGLRSTFSNHTADASGCAPGTNELGMSPTAATVTWSGTSASCPHMARLCAMGATGATFTPAQIGAALKANCRDTGQPDSEQGGGAYDLQATLATLGGITTGGDGTAGDSASTDYHPVAIVWPTSDKWPDDGEYDFMENGQPAAAGAEAYLHYPHSSSVPVQQEHATKANVDLSQWHNFGFEWTSTGITGYLDGAQWFHYAGGAITGTRKNIQDMPSGHLTLQLDAFAPSGLTPATMEVDWVRVYSLTPQGDPGTGGGGGGTSTGTLADRLRLGAGAGLNKVNLGIDFLPGQGPSGKTGQHVDYPLNILTQSGLPPEFNGYCDLRPDGAVRLTAYVGGATTPNSTHSRTESRELAANGVDKASWSSTSGEHYVWVKGAIIRLTPGRPHTVIAQIHDSADDVATIRVEGTNVVSTYGDSGRPGTLATGLQMGSVHQWMLKTVRSGSSTIIQYFWDDMTTPKATQSYSGGSGCYFKAGNYQQSSTSTDSQGEQCVVDFYDMEQWHTGYPEPTARH